MPAIVEFPKVVQDAARDFGDLFSCEPQRRHFAEYLTGLMIAQNELRSIRLRRRRIDRALNYSASQGE